MMPDMATGTAADLPEGLREDIAKVPHIKTDAASFVEAKVPKGKDPADVAQCHRDRPSIQRARSAVV